MIDPLEGIRLKMERAKTIINDLNGHLDQLTKREPYTIRVDEESEKGRPAVTLTAVRNPSFKLDINIGLLAGEALYHLRSRMSHRLRLLHPA